MQFPPCVQATAVTLHPRCHTLQSSHLCVGSRIFGLQSALVYVSSLVLGTTWLLETAELGEECRASVTENWDFTGVSFTTPFSMQSVLTWPIFFLLTVCDLSILMWSVHLCCGTSGIAYRLASWEANAASW